MKRIRIVGLCLLVVFAVSAIAAGTASANPEYHLCGPAAKETKPTKFLGHYTLSTCSDASKVATGGKFERETGAESIAKAKKLTTKNTNGKSTLYVYIPGTGIVGDTECVKAKGTGVVTGPSTATDTTTFEKCKSSGKTCTSTQVGEIKGDITTDTLDSTLVTTSVGTDIGNEIKGGGPGGQSAEFNCEGEEISTTGAVNSEVTLNTTLASTKSTDIFAVNGEGAPTIPASEPLLTTIVGVGTLPSGEETKSANVGEKFVIA
jgi:hypothetical protein